MSVTVNERLIEQTGRDSKDLVTKQEVRTYQRQFIASYSHGTAISGINTAAVLALSGVPELNDTFPGDTRAICSNRTARSHRDEYQWLVTIDYTIPPAGAETDPTDEDPIISFSSVQYTIAVQSSYVTGDSRSSPSKVVVNSARNAFDPPITQEESRMIINIQQNLKRFNPLWIYDYENTINKYSMRIAGIPVGAGNARMVKIDADKEVIARTGWYDLVYWRVQYQIELNAMGYAREILDAGYYYLNATKKQKPILDEDDDEVTEPAKLNGSGGIYVDDSSNPYDGEFLTFNTYWTANWKTLKIPRNA